LARAASEATAKAIFELEKTNETLLNQWQTLVDLGNPALSLDELSAELKQKIARTLEEYEKASVDNAIAKSDSDQKAEALNFATQHYLIEFNRLQALKEHQIELEELLAELGKQETALKTETQKLLDGIKEQIAQAEKDLAKAKAKLLNPLATNVDTNPEALKTEAENQRIFAQNFRNLAQTYEAERQNYAAAADAIGPSKKWQVIGYEKGRSGRRQEIWGLVDNPQAVKARNQNLWRAGIAAQNRQAMEQLAAEAENQANQLTQRAQLLEAQQNNLPVGNSEEDAAKVLEFLQKQAEEQQNIASKYQQLANLAERRRQQNQDTANWHNSQAKRREVVGQKRTGRSGRKTEPVYGWRRYPEHIAPRDQAQQMANVAAQDQQAYQQLAIQAQQQADKLKEQAQALQTRLKDWPILKQGIL